MTPHLLYVGGEDHNLRIPFMLAMRDQGFQVTAAGSGGFRSFQRAGLDFRPFRLNRFISPLSDWTTLKTLSAMLRDLQPDLAQSFDTKLSLLLPLAAQAVGHPGIVRTIYRTGLGLLVALAASLDSSSCLSRTSSCGSAIDCCHRVRNARGSGFFRTTPDGREKWSCDPRWRRRR